MLFFVNSSNNYDSDFVLQNENIPCIPENDTGLSIISCSCIVRYTTAQLALYKAERLGVLADDHIKALIEFLKLGKALTRAEKALCIDKLTLKAG